VTRSRGSDLEDKVVSDQSSSQKLYRLFAVEPHGWSNILLEDQQRAIYLASTATGRLVQISHNDAERLLADRSYRIWRGERRWAPLSSLPLVAAAFSTPDLSGSDAGI
jgi:hypothetical protein